MSKRSPKRPHKPGQKPGKTQRRRRSWLLRGPRLTLLGLAAAGCLLTGYLLITHWTSTALPYCGQGSSCDIVQSSRWSTLLGMPMSLWGFGMYLAVAWSAGRGRKPERQWKFVWLVSLMALAISLYLTWVSFTQIQALCLYCLASLGLVTAIFVTVCLNRPSEIPGFRWLDWAGGTGLMAAAVVVAMHLHYIDFFEPSISEEEDPYLAELAMHLEDSDAVFYGTSWCPHCKEQKSLFRGSASRLPYVECTPQGRGTRVSPACVAANVSSYPTWVIDGKRYTRVLSPDELAEFSGFEQDESESP